MSLVKMADLYAHIHRALRQDTEIRKFMGFGPILDKSTVPPQVHADWVDSDRMQTFKRIQKRNKPQHLIEDNFPIISFYTNPGRRGENHLEYVTVFDFDIYTQDDVELAMDIADRIGEIFNNQYMGMTEGSHFKGEFLTACEAETDQENTYKFFTQIIFTIGLEE